MSKAVILTLAAATGCFIAACHFIGTSQPQAPQHSAGIAAQRREPDQADLRFVRDARQECDARILMARTKLADAANAFLTAVAALEFDVDRYNREFPRFMRASEHAARQNSWIPSPARIEVEEHLDRIRRTADAFRLAELRCDSETRLAQQDYRRKTGALIAEDAIGAAPLPESPLDGQIQDARMALANLADILERIRQQIVNGAGPRLH